MKMQRKPSELLSENRDAVIRVLHAANFSEPRVFGSVARHEDTTDSDVDLLVTLPQGTTFVEIIAVEQELADILGCRVEILGDSALGQPRYAGRIQPDLVPL